MQIELNREEAEILRHMLRQRVEELDREINRTDSLEFKHELQRLDRSVERMLGRIATALEHGSEPAGR